MCLDHFTPALPQLFFLCPPPLSSISPPPLSSQSNNNSTSTTNNTNSTSNNNNAVGAAAGNSHPRHHLHPLHFQQQQHHQQIPFDVRSLQGPFRDPIPGPPDSLSAPEEEQVGRLLSHRLLVGSASTSSVANNQPAPHLVNASLAIATRSDSTADPFKKSNNQQLTASIGPEPLFFHLFPLLLLRSFFLSLFLSLAQSLSCTTLCLPLSFSLSPI